MAHLPGIEKLLRCMLVRDPARRATLADISRRQAFHSTCYPHQCSIEVTSPRSRSSASAAQSAVMKMMWPLAAMETWAVHHECEPEMAHVGVWWGRA